MEYFVFLMDEITQKMLVSSEFGSGWWSQNLDKYVHIWMENVLLFSCGFIISFIVVDVVFLKFEIWKKLKVNK